MPTCWSARFSHWAKTRQWKTAISKDDGQHRTSCWFDLLTNRRTGNQLEHTQYCQTPENQWQVFGASRSSICHSWRFVVFQLRWSTLQRNRRDWSAANDCCVDWQWRMQACAFHWWEGILPQPAGEWSKQQSLVRCQETLRSSKSTSDWASQVRAACHGFYRRQLRG